MIGEKRPGEHVFTELKFISTNLGYTVQYILWNANTI